MPTFFLKLMKPLKIITMLLTILLAGQTLKLVTETVNLPRTSTAMTSRVCPDARKQSVPTHMCAGSALVPTMELNAATKQNKTLNPPLPLLKASVSNYSSPAPRLNWPCPIQPLIFNQWLSGYNVHKKNHLVHAITHGFIIPSSIDHNPLPPNYTNHRSAFENHTAVSDHISKELNLNRILGPFQIIPADTILSPLAAVPKKDSDQIRLIHDLSFPLGDSVNSHIPRHLCRVEYELIDHCLQIILNLGQGCLVSKADISNAFRILPVSPSSYHLLGFQWQDKYYLDKSLPMGCSVSCSVFEDFSSSIQWILVNKLGVKYTSHILDDFMFFGHANTPQCNLYLQSFLQLSKSIGLPIKASKTVQPTTLVQLHGLEVCTIKMEVRLPQDKVAKALALIHSIYNKRSVTLVRLQSLIGTLTFAMKVVIAGRAFLRRLIDLTMGVSKSNHHINLNSAARLDLKCWDAFLTSFNGIRIINTQPWRSAPDYKFFSDASGMGYAAIFGDKWIQGSFPESWRHVNIATKELFPISMAFRLWYMTLVDKKISFISDNMSVVMILMSHTSKDPQIMALLRPMVLISMLNNIQFQADHIPGKHNLIPDLLSRFQISKARSVAPWLQPQPHQIPRDWLPW